MGILFKQHDVIRKANHGSIQKMKNIYVCRQLSSKGLYSREEIFLRDGFVSFDENLAFFVTRYKENENAFELYSECVFFQNAQTRFLSSIAMSAGSQESFLCYYPVGPNYYLEFGTRADFRYHETRDRVIKQFKSVIASDSRADEANVISKNSNFKFVEGKYENRLSEQIFESIDPNDPLLIRGLETWLKSHMLNKHEEFLEESIMSLMVSMEAALNLIYRKLNEEGNKKPTRQDATEYIGRWFKINEKFYGELYEQRILAIHPSSKFGETAHAAFCHDDFIDYQNFLRHIFVLLISGIAPKEEDG